MTSLLAQQAAAFRKEHGIPEKASQKRAPPPSLLFTPEEAKQHDASAFAAMAQGGLTKVAALEPDVASLAPLFQGQPRDRELLTHEENERLNKELRRALVLISPHLQVRAAQEILEGLIHRYHVHRWNVDGVLASALPYHDSPLFTTLLQGLHVKGNARWGWLESLRKKPATLVRAALAKYCSKDFSVLAFVGEVVMESARLHKANRPLATFFAAVWLDTLAVGTSVSPDLVGAALPALLLLLRRPHLRDLFHAALVVTCALCIKVEIESGLRGQLLERIARQVGGEHHRIATTALALILQLQGKGTLPEKAMRSLSTTGAEEMVGALPQAIDCRNLLASVLEACLWTDTKTPRTDEDVKAFHGLASGLLSDTTLSESYAEPLALAALQAFTKIVDTQSQDTTEQQRATEAVRAVLTKLGARQPAALGAAFRRAAEAAAKNGLSAEPLVQLVAPACAVVSSEDGSAIGSVVPVVQAFAHRSAKVRAKAVLEATRHLLEAGDMDDEKRQTQGQPLLASLILQATQDESAQVVQNSLQSEDFWTTPAHVAVAAAAAVLEALLARLLHRPASSGKSLGEMFEAVVLGDAHRCSMVLAAVRCSSWVYGRSDCTEQLRRRMDSFLLPLLVLCVVGSDLATTSGRTNLDEIKAAVRIFCAGSEHSLYSSVSGGAVLCLDLLAKSVDVATAAQLCSIVEGVFRPADSTPAVMLGGMAAQTAAALLLASAVPKLLESTGVAALTNSDNPLAQSARACRRLARQQAVSQSGACAESLRRLLQGIIGGVSAVEKRQGGGEEKKKKRRSLGSSSADAALVEAVRGVLRLVLDRPRSLAAELRQTLGLRGSLVRPALLRLAFGPDALESSVVANALLMIRSYMGSASSADWAFDQTLVVPLMSRLAAADAKEVRAASLEVLSAMQTLKLETGDALSWDSPCAAALRGAGVLREASEVLSPKGWAAAQEQKLEIAGLPAKAFQGFLEHVAAHRAEILQDRSAAASVLSKFLGGKGGPLKGAARGGACAFWATGLCMLTAQQSMEAPSLLPAIPVVSLIGGVQNLMGVVVAEVMAELRNDSTAKVPEMVRVVALTVSSLAKAEGASPSREKAQAAMREALTSFLQRVALPFCKGLTEIHEKGAQKVSQSLAESLRLQCQCLASASKLQLADEVRQDAVATLFGLGVAAGAVTGSVVAEAKAEEETPSDAPQASTASVVASSALVDASLDSGLLQQLVQSTPALRGKQLNTLRGCAAAELLCSQVVGLSSLDAGASDLLVTLGKSSQDAAAQLAKALAAGKTYEHRPAALHLLLAVAALSEHLDGSGKAAADGKAGEFVSAVCASLSAACGALGKHLTGPMLAAVVRCCGALAPLAGAPSPAGKVVSEAMPASAQTCLDGLGHFAAPLGGDVVGLLRANLQRLWAHPGPSSPGAGGEAPAGAPRWDAVAQARVRRLLYGATAAPLVAAEAADAAFFSSVARSAGAKACLDFALLLFVARKSEQGPETRKNKKRPQRKRRSGEQGITVDEDMLESMLPSQEALPETVIDDALGMLTAASAEDRYHCFGTLMQTICCLATGLSEGESSRACWGLRLVPADFLRDAGSEKAMAVLAAGLRIASRFLAEHGLPDDLDDLAFDGTRPRATVSVGAQEGEAADTHASALCYAAWAACATEVLLGRGAASELPGAEACKAHAAELRVLLMRSLAVNHPLTFMRAVCLTLQVPGHHPEAIPNDLLSEDGFKSAVVARVMGAASEALKDRKELRAGAGLGAGLDEDSQGPCAPLCTSAMKHIVQTLLSDKVSGKGSGEDVEVMAWSFIDSLCWFCGKTAPKPVLKFCVPSAAGRVAEAAAQAPRSASVTIACCICLKTTLEQLGRGILEKLNTIAPPLLDLARRAPAAAAQKKAAGAETSDEELIQKHVLEVLLAMVKIVGNFLSPYLDQFLQLTTAASGSDRTPRLEELGQALVEHVPHRLLLPAVQSAVGPAEQALASATGDGTALADINFGLVRVQRLAVFSTWIFSKATPEFISAGIQSTVAALLRMLASGPKAAAAFLESGGHPEELPDKVLRQAPLSKAELNEARTDLAWAESCAQGTVLQLNGLGATAFTQFALRLDLDELRPCFAKVLDWARDSQATTLARQGSRKSAAEEELSKDTEGACRVLALSAVMQALAGAAPGISEELLLPLVAKDLASSLIAARRYALRLAAQHRSTSRKRRKAGGAAGEHISISGARAAVEVLQDHTWWWFDVSTATLRFAASALRPAAAEEGQSARAGKVVEETVEALAEPCVELLDTFEFLPPAEASVAAGVLQERLQGAVVALASQSEGAKVKQLFTSVLGKTRSEDVEVRLCAVRCCTKVWAELGVQVVTGLSEVVMFASELLEDEDSRVEDAVRVLIKTIEDCTGESLQDALKQ